MSKRNSRRKKQMAARTSRNTQNGHTEQSTRLREVEALRNPDERILIPLVEESLTVEKNWVEAGQVLIKKHIEERNEMVPVDLAFEEAAVERVPVNRFAEEGEDLSPRQEGDTMIIPIIEEVAVVTKRLVIREEVRITKQQRTRHEEMSEVLRSEQISLDTKGALELDNQ